MIIRDFPDFSKIYSVLPASHQTGVFFFFLSFFFFCLNAAKKTSHCYDPHSDCIFRPNCHFPFFLCNEIELNIVHVVTLLVTVNGT